MRFMVLTLALSALITEASKEHNRNLSNHDHDALINIQDQKQINDTDLSILTAHDRCQKYHRCTS